MEDALDLVEHFHGIENADIQFVTEGSHGHEPGAMYHLGPGELTQIVVSGAGIIAAVFGLATAVVNWMSREKKRDSSAPGLVIVVNQTIAIAVSGKTARELTDLICANDPKTVHIREKH